MFLFLGLAEEGGEDGNTVGFDGDFCAGKLGGGGHEIDVGGEEITGGTGSDFARPASHEGGADSAFVEGAFYAAEDAVAF